LSGASGTAALLSRCWNYTSQAYVVVIALLWATSSATASILFACRMTVFNGVVSTGMFRRSWQCVACCQCRRQHLEQVSGIVKGASILSVRQV
jgi:hypothetical protein